jgi:hypothetical protein
LKIKIGRQAGNTTPTDSRSQRNWAGRRGGQLKERVRNPSPERRPARPACSRCPSPRWSHHTTAMEVLDLRREGAPNNFIAHKGRIERLFGTFQDRLVVELRFAQARTLSEAQRVVDRLLPRYNARFAHAPAHPAPAWRPAPSRPALTRACCFKYRRTVQHDNTVQLEGRLIQLRPGPGGRSFAGARVDVLRGSPISAGRSPISIRHVPGEAQTSGSAAPGREVSGW